MLFFRTGWMCRYLGESNDRLINGGAYVQEHELGLEVFNFLPISGTVYGFVEPPSGGKSSSLHPFGKQINLERLGGSPSDAFVDGVTVVFVARPETGKQSIVGWYRNARVYRDYQHLAIEQRRLPNGEYCGFFAAASEDQAQILPLSKRGFEIPKGGKHLAGMGQSQIWYADEASPQVSLLKARVSRFMNYIQSLS